MKPLDNDAAALENAFCVISLAKEALENILDVDSAADMHIAELEARETLSAIAAFEDEVTG